jgi:signal peptidase I
MNFFHRARIFGQSFFKNAKEKVSHPETKEEFKKFARDFVIVAGTFHVVGTYFCSLTICMGPSMIPTFDPNGDMVVVDKFSYVIQGEKFRKGDIVIAQSPTEKSKSKFLSHSLSPFPLISLISIYLSISFIAICKRVRGTANEIILNYPSNSANPRLVRIPSGHVWLQGDNAANSTDSRVYGAVPEELLKGRVIGKFSREFPFFHKLSRHAPEDKTDYYELNRQIEQASSTNQKRSQPISRSIELDQEASELLTARIEQERDRVSGYQAIQARRAIVEAEESGFLKPEEAMEVRRRILGPEEEVDRQRKMRLMEAIRLQRQRAANAAAEAEAQAQIQAQTQVQVQAEAQKKSMSEDRSDSAESVTVVTASSASKELN